MRLRPYFAVAAVLALSAPALSACEQQDSKARVQERQQRVDPPQLWRVEPVTARDEAVPVLMCLDSIFKEQVTTPQPTFAQGRCERVTEPVRDAEGTRSHECVVGGRRFRVATYVTGDEATDYTARLVVTDITAGTEGGSTETVLRFIHQGPCAADWRIGEQRPVPAGS